MTEKSEKKVTTAPPTKQVRVYQPTYRLNPQRYFSTEKVERILQSLLPAELEEVEYSDKIIPELCLSLAETVRNAVKEENYDRYLIMKDTL